MTASIPYRPEIDGLRAVAIVAVVLYHLDVPAFAGGFVGVDVFFVISGYLIFSLLYQERATTGAIDWKAFYARRITRLLPEATVLIVVVVIAGYFVLLPTGPSDGEGLAFRRLQLAQSGAAGTLWIANLHFWQHGSGYFAPWSGREPLIHLWSLGVEEQFYLVVPLMFILAGVLSRNTRRLWIASAWTLLASTFIVSLTLAMAYAGKWSAFYLLPSRAYEFAIGAALALWMERPGRTALSATGAAALAGAGVAGIAVCVAWLDSARFPGAWALLPTVSAAGVILGTATPNAVRSVLALRPLVYLGRISYGWYLWHWPLLVLWRECLLYSMSPWSEFVVGGIALLPAAIGYHWVYRLRRRGGAPGATAGRIFGAGASAVAISLLTCGASAWAAKVSVVSPELLAMNARMNDGVLRTGECVIENFDPHVGLSECTFGDPDGSPTMVLWGDSHAAAWLPGFTALFSDHGIRGVQRILLGCPPGFVQEHPTSTKFVGCNAFNRAVIDELIVRSRKEKLVVILAARWAGYVNPAPLAIPDRGTMPPGWAPGRPLVEAGLGNAIGTLRDLGTPVGIIHSAPELLYSAPVCIYRWSSERCGVPTDVQRAYLKPAVDMVTKLATTYRLPLIDPVPLICTEDLCRASAGDVVFYWDDDHLSTSAMRHLREPIRVFVDELIQQQKRLPSTAAKPAAS